MEQQKQLTGLSALVLAATIVGCTSDKSYDGLTTIVDGKKVSVTADYQSEINDSRFMSLKAQNESNISFYTLNLDHNGMFLKTIRSLEKDKKEEFYCVKENAGCQQGATPMGEYQRDSEELFLQKAISVLEKARQQRDLENQF